MLELMLCSALTVLPDYLIRRIFQGKRFGKEITLYSVWYELRYGISACLILTISLITTIFYFHPATGNVISFFRTVPVLTEKVGRVAEVYVGVREQVKAGQPLFKLDTSEQEASAETARRKIAEADAALELAKTQLAGASAQVDEAQSAYQQSADELATKEELLAKNASTVAEREIEKLRVLVQGREAGVQVALANKQSFEAQISSVLPAQKASAEAQLAEAQVELDKAVVRAGVDGYLEQFTLRKGDIVNPVLRPAGVLIPSEAGRKTLQAGFNQIEAQVIKEGMLAEVTCAGKPWTIIPMVITQVQNVVAAGQVRGTDQLIDVQQAATPGTITAYMEPLYAGGLDGLPPGSSCIANAYTSNEERLASDKALTDTQRFFLHAVDAVGLVHAMILRLQAVMLPVQTLVLSGGH
jgi:multidrug resistance efflux pump